MKKYIEYKNKLIEEAIDFQTNFNNNYYSYDEILYYYEYFYKNAKRYGLLKEFKENGII